jgi:alpha 1,6-mannosyltransferase
MITFRKALVAAAFFLVILYTFSHTHANFGPTQGVLDNDSTSQSKDTKVTQADTQSLSPEAPDAPTVMAPLSSKKQPADQETMMNMARASLQDKLAYQFPYDVESKFPAYIWQTWKYTPASGQFGETFRPAEASWSEKHPGFVHEVVTDDVAVHLMRHLYASVPEVLEAYEALPLPVLKADFFRYLILLARGGIYTDIDTFALRTAAEWIPDNVPIETVGLVIGIEADPDRPDWAQWYSRRIQFCQWTIEAKAGHPVLREIVTAITKETLTRKQAGTLKAKDKSVVEFTGPAIWTDTIFNFFNDPKYFDLTTSKSNITWEDFTGMKTPKKVGDVVVLPITSFSPGVQQMGAQGYDDPMAFVKHSFEGEKGQEQHFEGHKLTSFKGTWKPEKERHVGS